MRNKLLAAFVTLAGFGGIAAITPVAAQAVPICPTNSSGVGSVLCKCPTGNGHTMACKCPAGNEVAAYCRLYPAGSPTVYDETFAHPKWRKPTLLFHVKRGLYFAPRLKKVILRLPAGIHLNNKRRIQLWRGKHHVHFRHHRRHLVTILPTTLKKFYIYLKRGSLIESKHLRNEIKSGKVTQLTFHLTVIDKPGKKTRLVFVVNV